MRRFLQTLSPWLPTIVWRNDPRQAFTLAHDAAAPGTRTFRAFGVAIHWTFFGVIVAHHRAYTPPNPLTPNLDKPDVRR